MTKGGVTLIVVVLLAGELPAMAATAGPCCMASEEARMALQSCIPADLLYPGQSLCGMQSTAPFEVFERNKRAILSCLLDIYWHGAALPDPCGKGKRVDGSWALTHIRRLDERVYAGVLETEIQRGTPKRLAFEQQLVLLGDRRHISCLLDFAEGTALHSMPVLEAQQRTRVLEVIASVDAREAIPRLLQLRSCLPHRDWMLEAVLAQLQRDAPALVELGSEPPGAHYVQALSMLDTIGAEQAALALVGRQALVSATAVSATNEIATRGWRLRNSLLLQARLLSPPTVALGDAIAVELRVQNVSRHPVRLPPESYPELRIRTTTPRVRELAWRRPPRTPWPGVPLTLPPGESVAFDMRADRDYVFDGAGRFDIAATLTCHDHARLWSQTFHAPTVEVVVEDRR